MRYPAPLSNKIYALKSNLISPLLTDSDTPLTEFVTLPLTTLVLEVGRQLERVADIRSTQD